MKEKFEQHFSLLTTGFRNFRAIEYVDNKNKISKNN